MSIPPIPPIPPIKDHTKLTNIGTNTHDQIDTHIAAANPHADSLNKTGDTMSGDLEFTSPAALEIANDAYAFKYKQDNDAGMVFSAANSAFELRDTLAVPSNRFFLTGIIRKGTKRVSTQYDKANTTLGAVTGLSIALRAGLTYKFKVMLFIDANATGGSKYAMAATGGLTATAIKYQITLFDNTTLVPTINARQTALSGVSGQAGTTAGLCIIEGTIIVNAAGTLNVAFAQNAASGTSSVLTESTLEIEEVL